MKSLRFIVKLNIKKSNMRSNRFALKAFAITGLEMVEWKLNENSHWSFCDIGNTWRCPGSHLNRFFPISTFGLSLVYTRLSNDRTDVISVDQTFAPSMFVFLSSIAFYFIILNTNIPRQVWKGLTIFLEIVYPVKIEYISKGQLHLQVCYGLIRELHRQIKNIILVEWKRDEKLI